VEPYLLSAICLQGAYRVDFTLTILFMFISATVFDADVPSVRCASILFGLIITDIFLLLFSLNYWQLLKSNPGLLVKRLFSPTISQMVTIIQIYFL